MDHIAQEVKVLDWVLPKVENKKGPKSLAPKEAETDSACPGRSSSSCSRPAQWLTTGLGISVASIYETSLNSPASATKNVRLLSTVSPGEHLKLGCTTAT